MAETAMLRLEEMLPEATYFIDKEVFTRQEMKKIMDERRVLELGVNSRTSSLKDFMSYINHEIKVECDRRERYEKMNILKAGPRDFTIIQRIHTLFNRCVSKYSSDVSVWQKYIEFCSTSGGSSALSKVIMRAIKRHPRAASFRVIAADRELQQGGLIAARKLLMRAVRIKTDDQLMIWQQLFKLECAAIHRMITIGSAQAKSTESAAAAEQRHPAQKVIPSCQAAIVVFTHAQRELAQIGRAQAFKSFAIEAVDSLEMALLGFESPQDMEQIKDVIRQ
jgi:hypothetical protein